MTPSPPGLPPVALTIAGTDSGGGAGVAADLKVFAAHGVWGTCAITAVTAQDTCGVQAVYPIPPAAVAAQIRVVADDLHPAATKTGMLGSTAVVEAVADALVAARIPCLVVDPVAVSKHGDPLLAPDAIGAMRALILPLATVVTPNLPEALALLGWEIELTDRPAMLAAALALLEFGPAAVLLKGGHLLASASDDAPDLLVRADGSRQWFEGPRIATRNTHGTGCVLSAAICAGLSVGLDLEEACRRAKAYVTDSIARGLPLGAGIGPANPRVSGDDHQAR